MSAEGAVDVGLPSLGMCPPGQRDILPQLVLNSVFGSRFTTHDDGIPR